MGTLANKHTWDDTIAFSCRNQQDTMATLQAQVSAEEAQVYASADFSSQLPDVAPLQDIVFS